MSLYISNAKPRTNMSSLQFYEDILSRHPQVRSSDSPFDRLADSKNNMGERTMREVGAAEWMFVEDLLRVNLAA